MRKYCVTINGQNYLIQIDGDVKRMGFFKTYYLEAECPQDAENLAVQRIIDDPRWDGMIHNAQDDRPTMHLHRLGEVETFEDVPSLETGYVYYPEEGTEL